MNQVSVDFEWGALEEVIVGSTCNLTVPEWTDEYEFVPPEEQEFVKRFGGTPLNDASPERFARVTNQLDGLVSALESLGVRVRRPRSFTTDEMAYLSDIRDCTQLLFPRDPIIVIGDCVIEAGMRDPAERKNKWPLRDIFREDLADYEFKHVAMPDPYPVNTTEGFGPGPFLEGGDTMLCGSELFVGVSGHASNEWGIDWLRAYLGDDYSVTRVPLSSSVLHLDCAMALLREGLACVCPDAFPDGVPDYFKNWQLINVSLEEASFLACNGLVVDERRNRSCRTGSYSTAF
jgi:N-dimethylarginine dimethylaminohydrolase